ncbi:GerAB/ArcD/ProY family transporter [Brevibacillus centrosporus]|uniref:Spore germination protein n=1 Tax=Brevibacillus centrosporus TaxID=54910 RepID=A0A1I3L8P9_9BACL|nr:GerAB/ArcD/ProY family transporter [Brevibacillus centrosporus]SFI81192.1 Spore germination protein [Brevibacillus centrosporus]
MLSNLIGGFMLVLIIMLSILVLNPKITVLYNYPSFILGRQINIGDFFQRMEAVVAIIWFLTIFVKLTMYCFSAITDLAQLLKLRSYRSIIVPTSVLIATGALIVYPNNAYMQKWDTDTWIPYSLLLGILYPLLLYVIGSIRKNREGRKSSPSLFLFFLSS